MVALDRLVDVLGSLGTHLGCAPRGRDVVLRGVALHDPVERPRAGGDELLVGVGVGSSAAAARLVGTTRAAAVALHGSAPLDARVAAAARRSGAAVLLVDPAVPWGQLVSVAQALVLGDRGSGDLFAVADAIAALVGGPVTIEDRGSRVLAYSHRQQGVDAVRVETILGRRVPEEARRALDSSGVFTHLAHSDEALFVPQLTEQLGGRLVAAVRAGRELLGSVWVEVDETSPAREAALVDGARTAALHLLRARASSDLERQAEADLVTALLDSGAPGALDRLGLPGGELRVIAVRAHVGDAEHGAALLAFERATSGFGWSRPGRSALFGNVLYTVLPCGGDPAAAVEWVRGLRRELPPEVVVRAGIGGVCDGGSAPVSRLEADECLALGGERPVVYELAWARVLLRRLAVEAEAGRLPVRGPVADLLRHDEEKGTRYAETLRAWLAARGDARGAARALGVHPNTLRYRLQRMGEVAALPLGDAAERLALEVALAVHGELRRRG
ncbi:PucR family transcriptional regulator [Actinosynnema mirum]|uniref:Putative transcriptional regulator, PucR family n=1 Tax=Actinosynnema mirum (strain ATCC 29888 / DSM 43827 / JCM 3225 / NBRC 14064 / NCIMB 13271 / NRRL B-12336 / IMRU 3971 / 101) TaxID=446462 RepID=C6WAI0_ACTMD|nr:PucR family transcriptional regulator [Actinosynnema mirum]ACU35447.1 putative transcriptional regulator, PucR family [Actinosynnema mirum DSM 43827]